MGMEKETSGTRPKGDASRRQVLQGLTLTGLASTGVTPSLAAIQTGSESFDPHRWWTQDYRIVQTNLREIDAREDPREIVKAVKDFGANAIVSNIGGIVAFYPTKLELHYRTPISRAILSGRRSRPRVTRAWPIWGASTPRRP
jgi:hypothetical protein